MLPVLHVIHPPAPDERWDWVLDVVFNEWLGISYTQEVRDITCAYLLLDTAELRIDCPFMIQEELQPQQAINLLTSLPLELWSLPDSLAKNIHEPNIPVIFGEPFFSQQDYKAFLKLDVFGSIFFMLSRFEELTPGVSDKFDRFPGISSLAYQENFLQRPIVDEYVEILWNALSCVMPYLKRTRLEGKKFVTCDVDMPYEPWIRDPKRFIIDVAYPLLKGRSIGMGMRRILNTWLSRTGDYRYDAFWCFDWYMNECERHGHSVMFYFIPTAGPRRYDATYNLEEPRVFSLLESILKRGHHIGMHASYDTYRNPVQLQNERIRLQQTVQCIDPHYEIRENRQHYLRWRVEETPDHLEAAGFEKDSTGGYADAVGFRFGTSKEFSMWSWQKKKKMAIKQKPLIIMDGSVTSYMGMSLNKETLMKIKKLEYDSLAYGGDFTLLWHNSTLVSQKEKNFFCSLLKSGS